MSVNPKVRTCLWFDDQALHAAEFYCSILPDSRIDNIARYSEGQDFAEPGKVLLVEFTLAGTPYAALNGGPNFKLSEAVSVVVSTEDQVETDRLLGYACRRRRFRKPMRLAKGPLRAVLANYAKARAVVDQRTERCEGLARTAADEKIVVAELVAAVR